MNTANIEHPAAYEAAVKARIVQNARTTFHRNNPDADAIIDFLDKNSNWSDFYRSLLDSFRSYGKLTDRQLEMVRAGMTKQAARDAQRKADRDAANALLAATSAHVGEPGGAITLDLTVSRIVVIHYTPMFYGDSGTTCLYLCRDGNGNAMTYKGTADVMPAEGETKTLTVTIKSHDFYQGVAQTKIQRPRLPKQPKVKKVKATAAA